MDEFADAEGAEGEETDDEEDDDSLVLLDVEERVRVGGAVGDEVLEPEPIERRQRGDDGVARQVGDVPALHAEEVVYRCGEQREKVDAEVEGERDGVFLGEDQVGHEKLERPVDEGDDEVQGEARGREIDLGGLERREPQRVVEEADGEVRCGEAEGDVCQELVVAGGS